MVFHFGLLGSSMQGLEVTEMTRLRLSLNANFLLVSASEL